MGFASDLVLSNDQAPFRLKYRQLFFDLDHTLWDFERNSRETIAEAVNHFELQKRKPFELKRLYFIYEKVNDHHWHLYRQGKMTKEELRVSRFRKTLHELGIKDETLSLEVSDYYISNSPYKQNLFPGAIELLEELQEDYRLHLITNGFREVQHIKLDKAGIRKYFRNVIISEEVGYKKPQPEIFHYALELSAAMPSEALMIGDNIETDIKGAAGVGIDQVLFNPKARRHNFKPSYQIQELAELREILKA